MTPTSRRRRPDETTEEYSAAMQKFKELEQRFYGGGDPRSSSSSGGFLSNLFQNRDQGGSGLQGLFGPATYPRYYDEDHERKWREHFGTGQERTNLDAPQTGLSAAQINLKPGPRNITGRQNISNLRTNNPAEVAGLGNVVSDPDGSMYGQSASPAIADYMAPQEDVAITKEEVVDIIENQNMSNPKPGKGGWLGDRMIVDDFRPKYSQESGKLNENISGNIYAKHGGSVFRNAYDQASNIMYRAKGGGLEGLKESIDINGQPHNLAYINPTEANLLKVLGGSGQKVNGVPAYDSYGWNGDWSWNGNGNDNSNGENGETGIEGVDWADVPGNISATPGGGGPATGGGAGEEGAGGGTPEGVNLGDIPGFEAYGVPGSYPAGPGGPDYGINGGMWEIYNKGLTKEQWNFFDMVEGRHPGKKAYALDAVISGKITEDMTQAQIEDALSDEQSNWTAAEFMYGNTDMSDEQKYNYATKYGQGYKEGGEEGALYALKLGITFEQNKDIQNKAKEDGKKGRDVSIANLTKAHAKIDWAFAGEPELDMFGKIKQTTEVWDLDAYLEDNEDLTEQAEFEAVLGSFRASFQEAGMNVTVDSFKFSRDEGILGIGPGVLDFAWGLMQGKAFNMDDFTRSLTHSLISQAGFGMLDAVAAAAHYVGGMIGEAVIGIATFHDTGLMMNIHESGEMTFQSPEDDPNYDPAAAQEGEGRPPRHGGIDLYELSELGSNLKAILEEGEKDKEDEEEKKETRSIAELVPKKGSSAKGTDSLLALYRSIYGPDANPSNVST